MPSSCSSVAPTLHLRVSAFSVWLRCMRKTTAVHIVPIPSLVVLYIAKTPQRKYCASLSPDDFLKYTLCSCGNNEPTHMLQLISPYRALRELTGYFEDYLSLSMSMSMPMILPPSSDPIDTTLSPSPPLLAFGTVPPSPAPTISNTAPPTITTGESNDTTTAGTDADTVISPGIEEGGSTASSPLSVTPGQIALIALVACAALVIGLLALRRILGVRSSSTSIRSISSGSDGSLSSGSDHGASQVDDSPA
jgi:hypothetical protein